MRFLRLAVVAVITVAAGTVWSVPAAAEEDAGWPMGGHDYANTRSNPVEQALSTATVAGMDSKWTFPTRGDVSATPAVVGGALYFPDWGGFFSKVDAANGELI